MFEFVKKMFKKKEQPIVLEKENETDITYENEIKKSKAQAKDTKETKSTLTFGN